MTIPQNDVARAAHSISNPDILLRYDAFAYRLGKYSIASRITSQTSPYFSLARNLNDVL